MASETNGPISRPRKLAIALAMASASAIFLHPLHQIDALRLAYAGLLAAAGVGLGRRSLSIQIPSRAVAWTTFLPMVLGVAAYLLDGLVPKIEHVSLALLTGGALLFARPMLHTAEARRSFAPKMFRSWFLAGCTATAATGIFAAGVGAAALRNGHFVPLSFALSLSLLASAIAVVRMRAWGILLGWATSVALLVGVTSVDRATGLALVLAAAVPVLMLLLPVLVARLRAQQAGVESVGGASAALAPARLRVATEPAEDVEHEAVGLPADGARAGDALRA